MIDKFLTKPLITGAMTAGLAVFNMAVYAQGQMPGAPEVEALKFILIVLGVITTAALTGINIWAAIKNKNHAQMTESMKIKDGLISDLKLQSAEKDTEIAKLKRAKEHYEIENERVEEENLRLKGQLKLKK